MDREYVINALHNHNTRFLRDVNNFTVDEVDYICKLNPVYLMTLAYLDKLNASNLSPAATQTLFDWAVRSENAKAVYLTLVVWVSRGENVTAQLERIAVIYPDIYLNIHTYVNVPAIAIPNVNIGTINTIKALSTSEIDDSLLAWIANDRWRGEIGKLLKTRGSDMQLDESNVRVMYLMDRVPNITLEGRLNTVFLLDDRAYASRCLLGHQILQISMYQVTISNGETTSTVTITPHAFMTVLHNFPALHPYVDGSRSEMLLFALMNGYIKAANIILSKMMTVDEVHSFITTYHIESPDGCKVMYKQSYQVFLSHVKDVPWVWSMIKHCNHSIFVRMFYEVHPHARVDFDDLLSHPTLFNTLPSSEKKRISTHPRFVDYANVCLAAGYRIPIKYISPRDIRDTARYTSGELDLTPNEIPRGPNGHGIDHANFVQMLPAIPSQTMAMWFANGTLNVDRVRERAGKLIASSVLSTGNPFRIAFYKTIGFW